MAAAAVAAAKTNYRIRYVGNLFSSHSVMNSSQCFCHFVFIALWLYRCHSFFWVVPFHRSWQQVCTLWRIGNERLRHHLFAQIRISAQEFEKFIEVAVKMKQIENTSQPNTLFIRWMFPMRDNGIRTTNICFAMQREKRAKISCARHRTTTQRIVLATRNKNWIGAIFSDYWTRFLRIIAIFMQRDGI